MKLWLQNNASYLPRFIVSGGLVVALDFGSYSLFYLLGAGIAMANVIGMVTGFIAGFFLHKNLTFQVAEAKHGAMFARYFLAFLVNLVIAHYCLMTFHRITGEAYIAKLATMFVVFISNFLISGHFVFTASKTKVDPK